MGRVIAVANQKGGVGKTTTSINLASSLAAAEVNTLLVDCDPQSNTSSGLGFAKDPDRLSTYHVLMGACTAEEALQKPELDQLWVIPAHKNLIGANLELVDAERREFRMRDALEPLRERFQFIVLDCPPALDLLTLNALVAADSVLIPMQPEYFALEGVSELLDTVSRIRESFNPNLEIEGVVLTMFDPRTSLAQQVATELRNYFGGKLCKTSIPRNVRLAEAPSHGKPALLYDVRSRGCESYIRLAKEVLDAEAHRRQEAEQQASAQAESSPGDPQAAAEPSAVAREGAPEAASAAPAQVKEGTEAAAAPASSDAPRDAATDGGSTPEAAAGPATAPPADEPAAQQPAEAELAAAKAPPAAAPEVASAAVADSTAPNADGDPAADRESYASLPPAEIAEAVVQAAHAPEAVPAGEQGD